LTIVKLLHAFRVDGSNASIPICYVPVKAFKKKKLVSYI
jgi:hypothetical protein